VFNPGEPITSENYIRKCLSGPLVKHLQDTGRMLQQDGAAAHMSGRTARYLASKKCKLMARGVWPARSPDLNVIETCRAIVQRRVAKRYPSNREELIAAVRAEWAALSLTTVNGLVAGFRRRCKAVKARRGQPPTVKRR
jgi:transposase